MDVLSYGGGRQTVAICVLIAKGVLPKPDRIVMADTGRENPMTWEYLESHVQPMLSEIGLQVEIAPSELATVDLFSHKGTLLIPAFTETGKLSSYCSGEWKREVADRFLRASGATEGTKWIGFAADETRRIKSHNRGKWSHRFPLVELMLRTADCLEIIRQHGLPQPHVSSCWMCPNKRNSEWRYIRDNRPDLFSEACRIDDEVREIEQENGHLAYLHRDRVPLRDADLDSPDTEEVVRQCGLGMCFV